MVQKVPTPFHGAYKCENENAVDWWRVLSDRENWVNCDAQKDPRLWMQLNLDLELEKCIYKIAIAKHK